MRILGPVYDNEKENWWILTNKEIYAIVKKTYHNRVGRDSSVGIATDYGLDGPGIESRWRRDFSHTSRPALGPTQRPVQWAPGLSPGVKRPRRGADHPPPSSAEVKKE
jgi:hypothetical protein